MENIFKNKLYKLLKKDTRLWDKKSKELNQTLLKDLIDKSDEKIIGLLLSDKQTKEKFFIKAKDVFVLKQNELKFFIDENKLDNSYTQYQNKIGLRVGNKLLSERNEVVLDWPFKDCVLEGGMTKEDQKRNEIFFNEVLAKDEIDRLEDPKAFVNWKRFTAKGEEKVKEIKRDKDGVIKENLIIKGNNLLALHSLKEQFTGKVKLIYIDPPYNTGNDGFKYNDNFNHSTWLIFMRNRLKIAKHLLRDDGVIFISIDDNEQAYLRVMCDEIFGKENYLNTFCWVSNLKGRQISNSGAAKTCEYVLCFGKKIEKIGLFEMPIKKLKSLMPSSYKGFNYGIESDNKGDFVVKNELHNTNSAFNEKTRPNLVFNIHYNFKTREVKFSDIDEDKNFSGFIKISPKKNNDSIHRFHAWRWSKNKIISEISNLKFVKTKNGIKVFTKIREFSNTILKDIISDITTTKGSSDIKKLFGNGKYFDYPKPAELIKVFVNQTKGKDIILDFFPGSGTTSQAVLELNKEDGGNRQFILVEQMNYVNTVTCPRVQKVMEKENIDDNFIYIELAEWNEKAKEKILKAKNLKELEKLFDELYERYFLNYNVKTKEFKEKIIKEEGFKKLNLNEQKKLFVEMLDMNQMYVNFSERADKKYNLSKNDIALSEEFYNSK